jgi:hypothetical protein
MPRNRTCGLRPGRERSGQNRRHDVLAGSTSSLGAALRGMVVSQGALDRVVPLEPASMPNRVVVQWDWILRRRRADVRSAHAQRLHAGIACGIVQEDQAAGNKPGQRNLWVTDTFE